MILAFIVYISLIFVMELPVQKITFSGHPLAWEHRYFVKKIVFWLPLLIAAFILGLRDGVGVDFNVYRAIYLNLDFGDIPEVGFQFGYRIFHYLHLSFNDFLIFVNVLSFYALYRGMSDYPAKTWIILFLFLTGQVFLFLNIIRQGIAFFILLWSVNEYLKRRFWCYLLLVLFACSFHFSALLFLVVPLLKRCRVLLDYHWIVVAVIMIFFLLGNLIFSYLLNGIMEIMNYTHYGRYGSLLTNWSMTEGSGMGGAIKFLSAMLVFLFLPGFRTFYKNRFDVVIMIYLVGTLFTLIFGNSLLLSRVSFLFISFQFVVFGLFVKYLLSTGKLAMTIIAALFLITYSSYFIGMILLNNNDCSPYHFCF